MNRTMKVFLTCAIGAGVGTSVALQLNHLFWWVGLLVGGFVGYFSYEFGAVVKAAPRAWKRATSWQFNPTPLYNYLQRYLTLLMVTAFMSSYMFLFPILLFIPFFNVAAGAFPFPKLIQIAMFLGGMTILFPFVFSWIPSPMFDAGEVRQSFLKWNLITLTVWQIPRFVFWFLPRGIFWVAVRAPRAIRVAAVVFGRFFWHLFRLIHSEERLLCGIDAAIGTVIGYFSGNALIGALAGGVFGVINYEIVSKRILHLVPIRTK